MSTTRSTGRLVLASLMSAALLLAACGDDEDDTTVAETTEAADPSSSDDESAGSSETTEAAEAAEPTGDTVEVELADYEFKGLPESVPAGTKLTVANTSSVEFHELVAFRLPDDEERTVEEILALPEEEAGAIFGGGEPAMVLLAGPDGGEPIPAVGDGTLEEPGRYLLMCSIPTGADPAEIEASLEAADEGPPPEDPDAGPPHFTEGMHAELIVE